MIEQRMTASGALRAHFVLRPRVRWLLGVVFAVAVATKGHIAGSALLRHYLVQREINDLVRRMETMPLTGQKYMSCRGPF